MGAALSFFVLEGLVALRGGIRSRIPMIRARLPQRPLLHGVTPANYLTKDFTHPSSETPSAFLHNIF